MRVDEQLNMSHQCVFSVQKAKGILGASTGMWPEGQGRRFSPSTLVLWPPHPGVLWTVLESPAREEHVGEVQKGAMTLVKGLEHFYKDRLRKLRLFSLENRGLWGDLIHFFKSLSFIFQSGCSSLVPLHKFLCYQGLLQCPTAPAVDMSFFQYCFLCLD